MLQQEFGGLPNVTLDWVTLPSWLVSLSVTFRLVVPLGLCPIVKEESENHGI